MPKLIPNPSFKFHESCYVYLMLHYIHKLHHNIPTHSKQVIQKYTNISTQHYLAQHLAQAEGSRSGESPFARRGLKQEQESNAGSRLGETPLAWASCVLAQNTLWLPGRPLAQEALGEPLHISPGRVKLAWARLSVSATVRTCTTHTHTQQRFLSSSNAHSSTPSQEIHTPQ